MTTSNIGELVKRYTEYDMIQTYTDLPDFPEFRARLLFAFLNGEPGSGRLGDLYTVVTSLVQIALDTHDRVPERNDGKDKASARARQLKVLAGDYFSSRFYHLLAEAGEIEMIRQLSTAICEVNRLKMNIYIRMKELKLSAEEYLRQTVAIKNEIFLSFARLFTGVPRSLWPQLLDAFTRVEVLADELFRLPRADGREGSWAFWHIFETGSKEDRKLLQSGSADSGKFQSLLLKYNVHGQLRQMLDGQMQLLSQIIRQLQTEPLVREVQALRDMLSRLVTKPKASEEC